MTECKYYFDESVELPVSHQLASNGLDVVSAHSLGALGDPDIVHLQRATELGCVLCTYDSDFMRLATSGIEHAGIIFAPGKKGGISRWVRAMRVMHTWLTAETARNGVFFLSEE